MRETLLLILHGADVVQVRVLPLAIAPRLNEGEDIAARGRARRPVVVRDQLVFQRREETLRDGVIPTIPLRLILASARAASSRAR